MTLGTQDAALGQVWHLPSAETLSTRGFIGLVYEIAGYPPKVSVMPPALLALIDHAEFDHAFGARVTQHREAIAATLDWFRQSGARAT